MTSPTEGPIECPQSKTRGTVAARRPQALFSHPEDTLLQGLFSWTLGIEPLQMVRVP
jgi:hypothetical protein